MHQLGNFRSWKLLAHIGANKTKTPLTTLAEEVEPLEKSESIGEENNPMINQAKEI